MPHTHVAETPVRLAEDFARFLTPLINGSDTFSLAVSGGRTPGVLFDHLATACRDTIAWPKLRLYWVDERCVPPADAESNYRLATEHLLRHVPVPEAHVYRMHGEADPATEAIRYNGVLHHTLGAGGKAPQLDMVLLGLGTDGHTASLFPDRLDLLHADGWCIHTRHPATGQNRLTLTLRAINQARHVAFLVTGADKADRIAEIRHQQPEAQAWPAAYVKPESGNLHWFMDQPAAARL